MPLQRCKISIFVKIISTGRTLEEQAENVKKGVSWTMKSKHLTGKAIDLCPIRSYFVLDGKPTTKLQWDDVNPEWTKLGELAESLGLKWGGRWKQRDLGHVEMP